MFRRRSGADDFLDTILAAISEGVSWADTTLDFEFSSMDLSAARANATTCSISEFVMSSIPKASVLLIPGVRSIYIAPEIDAEDVCTMSSLHPDDYWGGDCCQARENIVAPGTACLQFELFAAPFLYEIAAKASGLERCTCCENGEYVHCSGQTAVCGTELPPPKLVNEACPSTGADCFCQGELPCASLADGDYICCPRGSWSSETDFKEYCRAMAGPGERCPGHAGANDNFCMDDRECGLRTSSDDEYICCERGASVCGISDCCKYSAELGEGCYRDDQCKSGLCNCGDDRLCMSYICCPNGSWNSGFVEYCRDMASPGEAYPGGAAANDNYCKYGKSCARDLNNSYLYCPQGSWTSGTVEYCRSLAYTGGRCPGGALYNDNYCKHGKVNGNYILCCANGSASSIQDGKEYCRLTLREGDRCVLDAQCNSPDRDCDCPGGGFDTCYIGTCE